MALTSFMTFPVIDGKVIAPISMFNSLKEFEWVSEYKCFIHKKCPAIFYAVDIDKDDVITFSWCNSNKCQQSSASL